LEIVTSTLGTKVTPEQWEELRNKLTNEIEISYQCHYCDAQKVKVTDMRSTLADSKKQLKEARDRESSLFRAIDALSNKGYCRDCS
jgi:hypothetical protein